MVDGASSHLDIKNSPAEKFKNLLLRNKNVFVFLPSDLQFGFKWEKNATQFSYVDHYNT